MWLLDKTQTAFKTLQIHLESEIWKNEHRANVSEQDVDANVGLSAVQGSEVCIHRLHVRGSQRRQRPAFS